MHVYKITRCLYNFTFWATTLLCAKCHTRFRKKPQHGSRYL